MTTDRYAIDCKSCLTSQGLDPAPGGVVRLPGDWTINHYRAQQGFLGWLALQPRYHRDELGELTPAEVATVGPNVLRVEQALRDYWTQSFATDLIQRVYVVYFFESPFDRPNPPPYHLHIHLIPRTASMGLLLQEYEAPSGNDIINAWKIHQISNTVAESYRRPATGEWHAAVKLITYLRHELERPE